MDNAEQKDEVKAQEPEVITATPEVVETVQPAPVEEKKEAVQEETPIQEVVEEPKAETAPAVEETKDVNTTDCEPCQGTGLIGSPTGQNDVCQACGGTGRK